MMEVFCVALWLLFLCTMHLGSAEISIAKPNCIGHCGEVSIPYPFGRGSADCYINPSFQITCHNESAATLTRFGIEVVEIGIQGKLRVKLPAVGVTNCSSGEKEKKKKKKRANGYSKTDLNFTGTPYFVDRRNRFLAFGCNARALLTEHWSGTIYGCDMDHCVEGSNKSYNSCSVLFGQPLQELKVSFAFEGNSSSGCLSAYIEDAYYGEHDDEVEYTETILGWQKTEAEEALACGPYSDTFIDDDGTMLCTCYGGFEGNPFLPGGCQDIDECKNPDLHSCPKNSVCVNTEGRYNCERRKTIIISAAVSAGLGLLLSLGAGLWLCKSLKRRRRTIELKRRYFERNGGLILEQQLRGGIAKTLLFRAKDIERATDNFNSNRILGKGGQGTVYKGILDGGRLIAVKKSTAVDEGKVEEFINEVLILSQIDHRNVVRLLRCCLETEMPLLVYEYVPNGTLYQYLSNTSHELLMTWDVRLRIASEVAEALSYLHYSATSPIYHRDVKSSNILLDEKCRAKLSDFGISRLVSIDQTHLTTDVKGTFGYLDPEYFHTQLFTDKSDVYSFGVVLVELLTGEKPFSSSTTQEGIVSQFLFSMKRNALLDILDARVCKDAATEEVTAVATLAKSCLNMRRIMRPTMKEVFIELERIQMSQKGSKERENLEEAESAEVEMDDYWDTLSVSRVSLPDTKHALSLEVHPLVLSSTI